MDLQTFEATLAKTAEAAVEDAVAAVKAHPDYAGLISQLAGKAIQTLAASI